MTRTLPKTFFQILNTFGVIFLFSGCGIYRANIDGTGSTASVLAAGSNVIGANGSLTASIPTGSYDGTQMCIMSDTNLLATNIKYGTTLFGVAGTYASDYMSMMYRDKGVAQTTLFAEAVTDAGTVYPVSTSTLRAIPQISKDDDGGSGTGGVTFVDRTGWGATTCGLTGTIEQRIADCAANGTLGPNALWDGAAKGTSGEGQWKLVSRTGAVSGGKGREVWRDERTRLMWSSIVATNQNWCKASGSNFITGNPSSEDDPSNVCDSVTYQNVAGLAISSCYEDGVNFTTTDANNDNAGKAGLDFSSTPRVAWRLPTMNDARLAILNGIRFVLPDATATPEWTATVRSLVRAQAQLIAFDLGLTSVQPRANSFNVRCVGR